MKYAALLVVLICVLAFGMLIGLASAQILPVATAATSPTEIITRDGVIVFLVNGQEQARINSAGLHVNGDIGYSGSLTDTLAYDSGLRATAQEQNP